MDNKMTPESSLKLKDTADGKDLISYSDLGLHKLQYPSCINHVDQEYFRHSEREDSFPSECTPAQKEAFAREGFFYCVEEPAFTIRCYWCFFTLRLNQPLGNLQFGTFHKDHQPDGHYCTLQVLRCDDKNQHVQAVRQQQPQDQICIRCRDKTRKIRYSPCGHALLCEDCFMGHLSSTPVSDFRASSPETTSLPGATVVTPPCKVKSSEQPGDAKSNTSSLDHSFLCDVNTCREVVSHFSLIYFD